ncbi:MAG: hypothetical protein GEU90_15425 [Gemmatimonas sp.]|nr:hypothetical protein [Gemmatimonas sp.]
MTDQVVHNTGESDLVQALSRHRDAVELFIERAWPLSPADWITPRTQGKWTPAQEAMHLVLTYQAYLAELREGPAVTPETFAARLPGFRTEILPRILAGGWFPSGGVSPRTAQPDDARRDKADVLEELAACVRGFDQAVLEAAARDRHRFVRHPYFGTLRLDELVVVLAEHTNHHRKCLPERIR